MTVTLYMAACIMTVKLSNSNEYMYHLMILSEKGSQNAIYISKLTGPEVIKLFSCSAQLRLKFILPINVKMPTIVGILTFISMINYRIW